MKTDLFNKFLAFLNQLEQQKINYQISHHRDETVATAGKRWEIEFLDNISSLIFKVICWLIRLP